MRIETVLSRFEGMPLDEQALSSYESWALGHFHNRAEVTNPHLEVTLQLELTAAEAAFRSTRAGLPGASLTAYLYWRLLAALNLHPCFTWRRLEGRWYAFNNLPLYFPVAVGGRERFNDVLLESPFGLDWPVFCRRYHEAVSRALQLRIPFDPVGSAVWDIAIFIGNLPKLQFTAFSIHTQSASTGRPAFYFGKRYRIGGSLYMPLYVQFDHANTDPYVLNLFLEDYQRLLAGD
jgi:chloramphenicol O-acetyltransferase type A